MWSCCCNRVEIPESWFQRSLLHHIRLTIGFFSITGRPVPLKSLLDHKPVNSNSYPLSSISLDRTRSIGLCLSFEGQLNNCYLFVHTEIDLLCFRFKVINLMIVKCRHPQAQEFSACYISDAWFYVAIVCNFLTGMCDRRSWRQKASIFTARAMLPLQALY